MLVAGLPAIGLVQLQARACYAVGDHGAPARIALRLVIANAGLNLLLVTTTGLGTAALALASSLCSAANAALLARALRRHVPPGDGQLRRGFVRSGLATAAMCAVLPFTRAAPADAGRLARGLGNVALPIAVGVLVYALASLLLRSPEMQVLLRRRRR
jgi:peptidoglycan biosynthesis protein MviN/MurJ (putative lipid II flippase)